MREAIVLAGGRGTRLSSVVSDVPKPMARVNGRPFLEYVLDRLAENSMHRIYLSVGYMSDKIQAHFGGAYKSIALSYVNETTPLGTGGGIRKCLAEAQADSVFVLNGDTFAEVNLSTMAKTRAETGKIVMGAIQVEDSSRYGALSVENGVLKGFLEKGIQGAGLINVGTYLIGKKDLDAFAIDVPFSFEKDYLQPRVSSGEILVCDRCDRFIDIGIPEDYDLAQGFFAEQ